eukprot:2689772-Prymnesium_polylepis.1
MTTPKAPALSTAPMKLLAFFAFLLLAAIAYNETEGWKPGPNNGRPVLRPAAKPLQARARTS